MYASVPASRSEHLPRAMTGWCGPAAISARKSSTRLVLPMPGSPATAAKQPCSRGHRRERVPQRLALLLPADGPAPRRHGRRRGRRPILPEQRVELAGDVVGGRAHRLVLRQHAEDQAVERRRQLGIEARGRQRVQPHDGVKLGQAGLDAERPMPGRDLVEDDAEREDVGGGIDRLAARLLRRHVGAGAEDDARVRAELRLAVARRLGGRRRAPGRSRAP